VLDVSGTVCFDDQTGKVERVGGIKWTVKDGIALRGEGARGGRPGYGRETEPVDVADDDGAIKAMHRERASPSSLTRFAVDTSRRINEHE
jgi:hypothetical protein